VLLTLVAGSVRLFFSGFFFGLVGWGFFFSRSLIEELLFSSRRAPVASLVDTNFWIFSGDFFFSFLVFLPGGGQVFLLLQKFSSFLADTSGPFHLGPSSAWREGLWWCYFFFFLNLPPPPLPVVVD